MSIGSIPINISLKDALESIGENIIVADREYNITWMNSKAMNLLSDIAPLFGLISPDQMIGINMDHFHKNPDYQRTTMRNLKSSHRTRITIKDRIVTDIIITPIKNQLNSEEIEGYMVMLTDVTTKAEEEEEKNKLIEELSVPILSIWEKTIALPLVGSMDHDRGEKIIERVLQQSASDQVNYVIISLRGINDFDENIREFIQKLFDSLKLMGVECVLAGVKPQLAKAIEKLDYIKIFRNAHTALNFIIRSQQ